MDTAATVNRLRAIATDHDLEADSLFRKARAGGPTTAIVGSEAVGKRNDAEFLRQVADDLEQRGGAD